MSPKAINVATALRAVALYKEGKTFRAISAECGISQTTLSRILDKYGVPRRGAGHPKYYDDAMRAEIRRRYAAGQPVQDIAAELGLGSTQTVINIAHEGGAYRRRTPHAPIQKDQSE